MNTNTRHDINVVGMRLEKVIGTEADEDEDDHYSCGEKPCNIDRYTLLCVVKSPWGNGSRKFTISLWENGGWCGSGYTTASFGTMIIKRVDDFGPFTHRPKDGKPVKIENAYYDCDTGELCFDKVEYNWDSDEDDEDDEYFDADVKNNVFNYSEDGGDLYYPSGYVHVNMDLFEACERGFDQRPVWIFVGDSESGKSTLGYYLKENKEVFETDACNNKLPEIIWADIIVVGNKYEMFVPDILKHLPDETEPIIVNFSKLEEETNEQNDQP